MRVAWVAGEVRLVGLSTVIARRSLGPKLMDASFVGSIQAGS